MSNETTANSGDEQDNVCQVCGDHRPCDCEQEETYRIVRFFMNRPREVIAEGVTLEEAQAHCNDPETSSKTTTTEEGQKRTLDMGAWFDGYEKE